MKFISQSISGLMVIEPTFYNDDRGYFAETFRHDLFEEVDVVSDQIGSPTNGADLAETILTIINNKGYNDKKQASKIYHYSNDGEISWYEFAKEIFKLARIECQINPISSEKFVTQAKRPVYTVMRKSKIKNVQFYNWQKSLIKVRGLI